jgi:hypothetical protein
MGEFPCVGMITQSGRSKAGKPSRLRDGANWRWMNQAGMK